MASNIGTLIDFHEREKGLPRQKIIEALEWMFLAAYRKMVPGAEKIPSLEVEMEIKTDKVKIFANLEVVEDGTVKDGFSQIPLKLAQKVKPNAQIGEYVRVNIAPKNFGRIEVQAARQVLRQRLMDAEKEMLFDEFKDRVGELITGTVKKFERNDVIVDLGKYEGIMPSRERIPGEDYSVEDRLSFYIVEVKAGNKGMEVVLSRSHPNLVRRLFETEVAEIADGTVEIHGIAREAGYRTKVAVSGADKNIDPVGACVGMRGARVKSIVRELNGEKVDVLRWHDDPADFVREALKPVVPYAVNVNPERKEVHVLVENQEELSKAIGRRGQNARLTARLMGWDVQVRVKPSPRDEVQQQKERSAKALSDSLVIDPELATRLVENGLTELSMFAEVEEADLMEMLDLDAPAAADLMQRIHKACQ